MTVVIKSLIKQSHGACPRLSVVVPVYNTERYLDVCVGSILGQSYPNLELILVDDGSVDASGVICDMFEKDNPRIVKVIHKPNGGLLMARRTGFAAATGDYVMSVDSDDMLCDGALDVVALMIEQTGADVIRFGFSREEAILTAEKPAEVSAELFLAPEKPEVLRMLCTATDGSQNPMCFKAVRRDCLGVDVDFSKFAGLSFAEDFLQTLVVFDKANTFCFTNAILYYYRPSLTSMTRDYSPRFYIDVNLCLDEGERYATEWEQRYSTSGLISGITACRLDSAAQYAESIASSRDDAALSKMRISPLMKDVDIKSRSFMMLRADRRIALLALKGRQYWLLRGLSSLRKLRRNFT